MSIDRPFKGANLTFVCDRPSCTEVVDTGRAIFGEALDVAKAEGMVARKVGDDWKHYCRVCRQGE